LGDRELINAAHGVVDEEAGHKDS